MPSLDPSEGFTTRASRPWPGSSTRTGPDAIATTLETDGTGAVYPVIYLRRSGAITEHTIDPDPLLDYRTDSARAALDSILAPVLA